MGNKAFLTKKVWFSAMHSLGNPELNESRNREIFGKCYRLHGHDYALEVTIEGLIDSASGLICDRDFFDDKLQEEIVAKYDKKNLNDFFQITTGECLAEELFILLKQNLRPLKVVGIRLRETPKNHFAFGTPEYLLQIY